MQEEALKEAPTTALVTPVEVEAPTVYMGLESCEQAPQVIAESMPKPPPPSPPKSPSKRAIVKTVDYQDLELLKRNTQLLFDEKAPGVFDYVHAKSGPDEDDRTHYSFATTALGQALLNRRGTGVKLEHWDRRRDVESMLTSHSTDRAMWGALLTSLVNGWSGETAHETAKRAREVMPPPPPRPPSPSPPPLTLT